VGVQAHAARGQPTLQARSGAHMGTPAGPASQFFFLRNLENLGFLGQFWINYGPLRNFQNKGIFRAFLEINAKFLENENL